MNGNRLFSTFIGSAICGALVFAIWPEMWKTYGIFGGWLTAVALLKVDSGAYVYRAQSAVEISDILGGFLKSIVFAILVSVICCYQGYFTHLRTESHGGRGVSISTTSAVVLSCVFILISDYIITSFLM